MDDACNRPAPVCVWLVAAGAFVTAVICGMLISTPEQWLVTGIGILLWVAVPGALIVLGTRLAAKA